MIFYFYEVLKMSEALKVIEFLILKVAPIIIPLFYPEHSAEQHAEIHEKIKNILPAPAETINQ